MAVLVDQPVRGGDAVAAQAGFAPLGLSQQREPASVVLVADASGLFEFGQQFGFAELPRGQFSRGQRREFGRDAAVEQRLQLSGDLGRIHVYDFIIQ